MIGDGEAGEGRGEVEGLGSLAEEAVAEEVVPVPCCAGLEGEGGVEVLGGLLAGGLEVVEGEGDGEGGGGDVLAEGEAEGGGGGEGVAEVGGVGDEVEGAAGRSLSVLRLAKEARASVWVWVRVATASARVVERLPASPERVRTGCRVSAWAVWVERTPAVALRKWRGLGVGVSSMAGVGVGAARPEVVRVARLKERRGFTRDSAETLSISMRVRGVPRR